jgi:hypothetical protein
MRTLFQILLLSLFLSLSACDLFNTRDPEDPNGGRDGFQPPTSAQIVINNFINSVQDKNKTNYLACFADTNAGDPRMYEYLASSDAYVQYPTIFDDWTKFSEDQYFNTMISLLEDESKPKLTLRNRNTFDILLSDSAVLITEYILELEHNTEGLEKTFGGTLQLTLYPNDNNFWAISRWSDNKQSSELKVEASWSILKARMINK